MMKKVLLVIIAVIIPSSFISSKEKNKDTLTLENCLQIVLNKNDEYKSYKYKLIAKKDKISEAKANLYYPNISANLSYSYHGTTPEGFMEPAPHSLTTSFDINKIIYNFGKFGALLSIAEQDYNLTKLDRINAKNNIIKNTQNAFYRVMLAKQNLEIIKNANKLLKKTLNIQKRNYFSGRSSKSQYIRTQILYETDKINIAKAKDNIVKTINTLFTLLGIKHITKIEDMRYEIKGNFKIKENFLKHSPLFKKIENVIAKARKTRLEIKKMRLQKNMLKLNKVVASSAYKPVLSVFGSVSLNYTQQSAFSFSSTGSPSIGLGDYKLITDYIFGAKLTVPLTELLLPNSSSQSQEKSIQSEILAINKNIDGILKQIEEDVIRKYLSHNESKNNIKIRKKIARLAKENFFIARKAYLSSTMDYLDYLDADLQYRTSQFNYYNELYNYNMSYLDLLTASGIYY